MSRRLLVAVAFLLLTPLAHAQEPARLGMAGGGFPEQWGNPFSSTSITRRPVWSALFDPLTLVSSDGMLEPWIAIDWRRDTPTTWKITLRPGVAFSNGEPVTANSVVAAVDYLLSDFGRLTPVSRELTGVTSAQAVDPHVVRIETAAPDPLLPFKLTLLHPLAADQWQRDGSEAYFANAPGTGPYVIRATGPTRTLFDAASTSWRRAPAKTLDYRVLQEPASRQAALATKEVDVAISALSPDEFESVRAAGGDIYIDRIPAVVTLSYVVVDRPGTPFTDERVRKAMTHAVNRQAIVDFLLGGTTRVASQPAPSNALGYADDVTPLEYDPDRARALLAEAGYTDGFDFAMEMPGGAVLYTDVFQQIAADLARVGINMEIQVIPQARFLENTQTGIWGADAIAMPMFTPVADALYPMRQNSCLWHAPYYCDPKMVPLINAAAAETGIDARRGATQAVMRYAHASAQSLFMYETVAFFGLSERVKDFRSDFSFIRYETMRLAE